MATTTMSLSLTLFFFLLVSTVFMTSALRNLSSAAGNNQWCVASRTSTDAQLQANLDWVCSEKGGHQDCTPINPGGPCFDPNTLFDHASWAMNEYYWNNGHIEKQCDFSGTGTTISTDPSHGACVYQSHDG